MPVNPTGRDLKRLLAEDTDPPSPIAMLNLLRFKEGGRPDYEEYARRIAPFLERVGGEMIYVGDASTSLVAPDGWDWDVLLVVRYPSRRAFCDMVADEEYQEITGLRTGAVEEAVLQATVPWSA
ncbi:MAG: DUF1330 domain-containing protein [Solirubrobacteraceae bacterium]|nr:DUF1330 domain-containing protein [Solirubrobacteraceae bacterium]